MATDRAPAQSDDSYERISFLSQAIGEEVPGVMGWREGAENRVVFQVWDGPSFAAEGDNLHKAFRKARAGIMRAGFTPLAPSDGALGDFFAGVDAKSSPRLRPFLWLAVALILLALSLLIALAPSPGWAAPCAQDLPPRFEDFPAQQAGTATRPALKLTNAFAREYRTSLREGLAHWPVDFAGHYVMVTHGCGTTCMTGGWVDAISGEATPLPGILDTFGPFEIDDPLLYRPDSRLLVTLGAAAGDATKPEAGYYEWTSAELRPVCTRILTADEARLLGRALPEKF